MSARTRLAGRLLRGSECGFTRVRVSKLVFRKSVSKDLRPIPNKDVARILQRIEALQENPRPADSEKLSGLERYRIRQSVYRIIYEITDQLLIVTLVRIGHRKDVYKRG